MRSKQLQAIRYFTTKIAPKNFAYSESELRSYYDVILVSVGGVLALCPKGKTSMRSKMPVGRLFARTITILNPGTQRKTSIRINSLWLELRYI